MVQTLEQAPSPRSEGEARSPTPGIELLAQGRCRIGVAKADITPDSREPMAGFSLSGSRGTRGTDGSADALWARVLYLEDEQTGQRALVCIVDLLSASLSLLRAAERALERRAPHLQLQGRLLLAGTHTHTAPGRFFGNRFYDRLAAPLAWRRHNRRLTEAMAEKIAAACEDAISGASSGQLSVLRGEVWGAGRNRSLDAHRQNDRDPELGAVPWGPPPAELDAEETAVDPRLTVLCAAVGGHVRGVFAWFGCHGTALGRKWKHYNRDWLGVAVDGVERELAARGLAAPGLVCAVGSGASGDITPLPSRSRRAGASNGHAARDTGPLEQGPPLARWVGQRVAAGILALVREAPAASSEPLPLRLERGIFEIPPDGPGPRWQIGIAALGGSEDGGPSFGRLRKLVAEGIRGDGGPHHPKAPALGVLQALTLGVLDIAPQHPWHRLWLGGHALCTVPGEPTVMAALTLERAMQRRLGVSSASVIGYAGDYCGYFTTAFEYRAQHYEGASTLYGPRSLEWYREQLGGPALPPDPDGRGAAAAVPRRSVHRLLSVAHQLMEDPRAIELLFAVARSDRAHGAPQVHLMGDGSQPLVGACRRYPPPDPDGAPELDTFLAVFEPAAVAALGSPIESLTLEVQHAGGLGTRALVPHERARENGELPALKASPSLAWLSRTLLALGLASLVVAAVLLVTPGRAQTWLGWGPATAFQALSTRIVGLTFLLLGVNLCIAKNSRDQRSVSGYPLGAGAFASSLAVFSECVKGAHRAALVWVGAAAVLLLLGVRLWRSGPREQGTPPRAHWEFWSPLFWVGLFTLVVGALLLGLPGPVATLFHITDPEAQQRLRLTGAGFCVNTIAMWRAQYTRDTSVVSAQLWGSLAFDSIAPVLLAIAIADDLLNALGLLLLLPFIGIVAWFSPLVGAVRARGRLAIEAPRTTEELARIVRDARRERRTLRVLGSGHSVPSAIHGGAEPKPRPRRPSNELLVHVSLERLDRVVAVDRERSRISVEAGMRIGVDPGHDASIANNLLWHLRALGLALPDLGGIVHQSVGGFLATGSSGGSVQHSLQDSVVELRYIDGTGQLRVLRRDEPAEREQLLALLVGLGLLGIVTEVTFQCEPAYRVRGRELTAPVVGGRATLPAEAGGAPARDIVLDSPGADGLATYLTQQHYCRILWWPQAKLSSMVIWEGARAPLEGAAHVPYRPQSPLLQFLAGRVLDLLGWSYAPGEGGVLGKALRRHLLPPFAKQFFPKKPIHFDDHWDINLPMDTHVDEAFLPVEFTELWFDIADTAAVMAALLELYSDEDRAGTFAVELYVAKASDAWLSPSHARDSFRVDIFWYQNNRGDPVLDYYPAFYEKLGRLSFRAHWGKYLPEPGSAQGARYLTGQYPRFGDFAALRRRLDPDGVFLTGYWRRHLGIQ